MVRQFIRKLGINLPQDPAIPIVVIYPKDTKSFQKDTCSTMFIVELFLIDKNWKQPRCSSIEEWIRKMWYIYTMDHNLAVKKNDLMKFAGK